MDTVNAPGRSVAEIFLAKSLGMPPSLQVHNPEGGLALEGNARCRRHRRTQERITFPFTPLIGNLRCNINLFVTNSAAACAY